MMSLLVVLFLYIVMNCLFSMLYFIFTVSFHITSLLLLLQSLSRKWLIPKHSRGRKFLNRVKDFLIWKMVLFLYIVMNCLFSMLYFIFTVSFHITSLLLLLQSLSRKWLIPKHSRGRKFLNRVKRLTLTTFRYKQRNKSIAN